MGRRSEVASGRALTVQLQADQRSLTRGFLAGILFFADSTELHFREYLDLSAVEPRQMYAYHFQAADGQLIFRYDNAVHLSAAMPTRHQSSPA